MYLYGASGHAKVIIDILSSNNILVKGLFDDNLDLISLKGIPVLHRLPDDIRKFPLIISIGNSHIRKKIASKIDAKYIAAIHNKSVVSPSAFVGAGTVVMNGANINTDTTIGKHAIVNTGSSIDHDCTIADYCHVSPGATLCGGITVGEGTHIGAGATIIPNIHIGKWVTIGAGTVVIKDIPDYAVVVGNPGRIIKYTDQS